jgi:hypothetical protein
MVQRGSYLRGGGPSFGVNGGRTKPTGGGEWSGGTGSLGTKREGREGKARREEEERVARRFKFGLVALTCLV